MSSPAMSAAEPLRPVSFARQFRTPIVILVAAATGLALLRYGETVEWLAPAGFFLARFSLIGLTLILLALWFVFLGPFSRAIRLRAGLIGATLVAAAVAMVTIDGVNGDMVPRLRFRWTPARDALLPTAAEQTTSAVADLTATSEQDYPQFMGRNRLATLENVSLARDWQAEPPKLVWRQPIGAGWSSYAVVGHYGVTQEQRGEEELVTCYDIDNGKLIWAQSSPVRFSETIAGIGPRATPTIHDGRVYAVGARGQLWCLDGATGKPLWNHQLISENGAELPQWGKSCSPLVYENRVIVSAGGANGKSLVAYDAISGEPAWSAGDDASSYSSPTVLTLHDQRQIVIVNDRAVTAHDPADGKILWRENWPDGTTASPNVSQPLAVGEDRLLLSKGYGVGSALWQIDREGDQWSVKPLWKTNNLKTKMTSAVVRDGYAYGLDEDYLSCIDIANGKKQWKKEKFGHGQVLLVDDLLLVQSETGEVALVEASPKQYRELARFQAVDGQGWNYPVLIGKRLLVRTELEAACWDLP